MPILAFDPVLPNETSHPAHQKTDWREQLQRQSSQKYECPNEVCDAVFHLFIYSEAFFRHRPYWTTMNIFAIVHEAIVRRKAEKHMENPTKTISALLEELLEKMTIVGQVECSKWTADRFSPLKQEKLIC